MAEITDEMMMQALQHTKDYCIVLLVPNQITPPENLRQILWEHARRNFSLRADGILSIVCPVTEEGNLSGLGIFNCSMEKTREIMDGDPAVLAGIFRYEIYPCKSFPGDQLPA